MNPFELGVIAANGFHAVASRRVVQRGRRTVQGESYDFFYNPMWGHLGDNDTDPPGTYYDDDSRLHNFFWNMFDQVLLRPELLPNFHNKNLQIISAIQGETLLRPTGNPDQARFSDHLPISFTLEI